MTAVLLAFIVGALVGSALVSTGIAVAEIRRRRAEVFAMEQMRLDIECDILAECMPRTRSAIGDMKFEMQSLNEQLAKYLSNRSTRG